MSGQPESAGSSRPTATSPGSTLDRLRHDFDRLIEAVWSQGEKAVETIGLRPGGRAPHVACDLVETAAQVIVWLELPGVDPDRVEVLLTGNMLTLSGEVPASPVPEGSVGHRRERCTGKFERALPLPCAVDPDSVVAEARHGLFTITLRKQTPVPPPAIRVPVKPACGTVPPPPPGQPSASSPE